jgi:hypothetical protein
MIFSSPRNFCQLRIALMLAASSVAVFTAEPVRAQVQQPELQPPPRAAARRLAFRAVNYEVNVAILPEKQAITARAKVEFEALEPSATIEMELHQDLRVQTVTGEDGKPLGFDRYPDTPLRLTVGLPQSAIAGQHVTLTIDYAGPLANDEVSPVKGVRLAYVSEASTVLLLPGRWFPVTDFPSNRYTGVFYIAVPESMTVVGTGEALPPQKRTVMFESEPAPAKPGQAKSKAPPAAPEGSTTRMVYTFRWTKPEPGGSFVAGRFQSQTARATGIPLTVFAPVLAPGTADTFSQQLSNIIGYFSSEFGGLPDPALRVAQLPTASLPGYSAPGLLLVGARQWDPKINYRNLAQIAAGQWFGNAVTPASASDVWLTDGLARYAEGLYVEHAAGREALDRALEDFAVGALMYDQVASIVQAGQLVPFSPEYRSVVQNKGAMVFHMLRAQMGDAAFLPTLRDFYIVFAGHSARIEDFEKLAADRAAKLSPRGIAASLTSFFVQWLNSTGVPEFKLDYVVVRTRKGFLLRGDVKQDLETFRMPVEVRVATEGNPETSTIDVVGTKSDFTIETFGRPKAMGVTIDPKNNLLKSSPKLRVRALIARGEEKAQRADFYEAIQEYQRALDVQRNSSLAHFRTAEAAFYQKNYQAAASAFREALDGDLEPKWVEVWSRIYLGKIFDLSGQRERAVNEYTKARDARDDTGGAQEEVAKYLAQPYKPEAESGRATP